MNNTIIFESTEFVEIPTEIIDKHLQAPETELRLILFLLRHTNRAFLEEDLFQVLKVDQKRLGEAFEYWIKAGVLYNMGGRYTLQRPRIAATEMMRYSADSIASRINEDEKVRFLYTKTEEILKKPLTTEDASTVLSLVDWIGLPAEVAALLIQHCGEEKKGLKKMLTTGIDWADKGIDSFEKAEEHLNELRKKKDIINQISKMLGITNRALTEQENKLFLKWTQEYLFGTDIIMLAYETTVQNTGKYAYTYMDTILKAWNKKGYKTINEIKENDFADKPEKTKKKNEKKYPERKVKIDKEAIKQLSWEILSEEDGAENE